jgi:hypothetical protein
MKVMYGYLMSFQHHLIVNNRFSCNCIVTAVYTCTKLHLPNDERENYLTVLTIHQKLCK